MLLKKKKYQRYKPMMIIKFKDDKIFNGWKEASEAIGIKKTTLYRRLNHNQFPFGDEPLGKGGAKGQKCYYKGKQYNSLTEAAKANNVSVACVSMTRRKQKNA